MGDEQKLFDFGQQITRLIQGGDLSKEEACECWRQIIAEEQPDLHQGAFMSAMAMKGETAEEIAGSFEAIYEHDTNRVDLCHLRPLVENCGTGRAALKTFNISTAASIIAAAGGVHMAKHGARAITSRSGTVDVLEAVGVDVECDVETVKGSVEEAGIGLFNGMSAEVHPQALSRILSQIRFGSTLHIAGSLANPARPTHAVRGVFCADMVARTADTMRAIGYERALVCFGWNHDRTAGFDELSTLGESEIVEFTADGGVESRVLAPEDLGIKRAVFDQIASAEDVHGAARMLVDALSPDGEPARCDIACLNAAAVLYVAEHAPDLNSGMEVARQLVESSRALDKLRDWVSSQNRSPEEGLATLDGVLAG